MKRLLLLIGTLALVSGLVIAQADDAAGRGLALHVAQVDHYRVAVDAKVQCRQC